MTGTREFIVAFFTLLMSAAHCGSAELDPPSDVTASWIDKLTVNLSWSWPKNLSGDCEVKFDLFKGNEHVVHTNKTHFLQYLLSDESDTWTYNIQTVGYSSCKSQKSRLETIVVKTPVPRVEVKDFKCYMSDSCMNCSWTADSTSPVSLYYRMCGTIPEIITNGLEKCSLVYNSGQKTVCHMKGQFLTEDLCMVAETASGRRTFKPKPAVRSPKIETITKEGSDLILTLTPLELTTSCWVYNICYSVCSEPELCQIVEKEFLKVPYDKNCQYEFKYRGQTTNCPDIQSDWSETVTYSSDWTLTVVAIVIPLIVSACVILSCYCFRRHKDIICPDIPDPSTIFKEMINNNKEQKTRVPMYVPVPEPTELITVVTNIPQNSCV